MPTISTLFLLSTSLFSRFLEYCQWWASDFFSHLEALRKEKTNAKEFRYFWSLFCRPEKVLKKVNWQLTRKKRWYYCSCKTQPTDSNNGNKRSYLSLTFLFKVCIRSVHCSFVIYYHLSSLSSSSSSSSIITIIIIIYYHHYLLSPSSSLSLLVVSSSLFFIICF